MATTPMYANYYKMPLPGDPKPPWPFPDPADLTSPDEDSLKKPKSIPPPVVVLDFDNTLATRQMGPLLSSQDFGDNMADQSFGGKYRVKALKEMIHYLERLGLEIHICTRNSSNVVRKALGPKPGLELMSSIKSVVSEEQFGHTTPKSTAIRDHILTHRPLELNRQYERMLFVDDNLMNVQDVERCLHGCTVLKVPPKGGMGENEFQFIKDWSKAAMQEPVRTSESSDATTSRSGKLQLPRWEHSRELIPPKKKW